MNSWKSSRIVMVPKLMVSGFKVISLLITSEVWRIFGEDTKDSLPWSNRMVVTEYDLVCNDDQLHADYLRDILTLTFSHPKMTGFINWGFWAGEHWKPEGALFRKDWKARPAVKVWRDLVKKNWWTEAEIKTNQGKLNSTVLFMGFMKLIMNLGMNLD